MNLCVQLAFPSETVASTLIHHNIPLVIIQQHGRIAVNLTM